MSTIQKVFERVKAANMSGVFPAKLLLDMAKWWYGDVTPNHIRIVACTLYNECSLNPASINYNKRKHPFAAGIFQFTYKGCVGMEPFKSMYEAAYAEIAGSVPEASRQAVAWGAVCAAIVDFSAEEQWQYFGIPYMSAHRRHAGANSVSFYCAIFLPAVNSKGYTTITNKMREQNVGMFDDSETRFTSESMKKVLNRRYQGANII